MSNLAALSTSLECNSSKISTAQTISNILAHLDENSFTISTETLLKAASINQTPVTKKNFRAVKHKRSKSSNSRINKNNFISNSRGNFKLSNMNTVPLAKLTETNDNYLQPKFIYYPPRLFTLFFAEYFAG